MQIPSAETSTTNFSIILIVAVISFATCGLLALATYLVDRNANRHDQ